MARFYLDTDNDSHWYVVPYNKRHEWNEFVQLDPDNPEAWDVPEYATPIDNPHMLTFDKWEYMK